jgi:hypothetical protein
MSNMDRTLTPIEAWEKREQITPEKRLIFLKAVEVEQLKARIELGLTSSQIQEMFLSNKDQESNELKLGNADRLGISRALENAEFFNVPEEATRPPLRG